MGVRTFDRLELTVEVLEDVDPREDGAEEEEVFKGEATLGKTRRDEVFNPDNPSVKWEVCAKTSAMNILSKRLRFCPANV